MEREKLVGFAVKALSNEIKRAIDSNFRSHCEGHDQEEITGMQRWIIQYLYDSEKRGEEVFQKDIENRFNIRRSTVTGILQLMEKNGYVQREAVVWDARLKKLALTKKAADRQEMVEKEVREMEARFVKDIPEDELEIFFKVIEKIRKNLED